MRLYSMQQFILVLYRSVNRYTYHQLHTAGIISFVELSDYYNLIRDTRYAVREASSRAER